MLATIADDGTLNLTLQRTKTMLEDQRWVDLFTGAGIPSKRRPEMAAYLRSHAPLTIAVESVTGMGMAQGRGANWTEATLGARGLQAGAEIVRAARDKPSGISRAPRLVLTSFLWAASRAAVSRGDRQLRRGVSRPDRPLRRRGSPEPRTRGRGGRAPGVAASRHA